MERYLSPIVSRIEPIFYMGYLQGFKVWLSGKKYPKQQGEWFTSLTIKDAVNRALSQRAIEERNKQEA